MKVQRKKVARVDVNPNNPIDVDDYQVSMQPQHPKQWLQDLGLDNGGRKTIQSPTGLLNDNVINPAQQLLQKANPAMPGLQDVALGLTLSFQVEPQEFVQVLPDGHAHCLTVSNIGLQHSHVHVFDSFRSAASSSLKLQISSLLVTKELHLTLQYIDVQRQVGGSDCGLFSIAFATALVFGQHSGQLMFDQNQIRTHLLQCLEASETLPFPVKKMKRTIQMKAIQKVKVYCVCRMPSCTNSDWIECSTCKK